MWQHGMRNAQWMLIKSNDKSEFIIYLHSVRNTRLDTPYCLMIF